MKRWALFGAIAVAACSRKPDECRAVVATITDYEQRISALGARAGADAGAPDEAALLRDAAKLERELAAKLAATNVTSDLAPRVRDYVAMANALAGDADALAAIVEKVAPMQAATDPKNPESVAARGGAAFARIDRRCAAVKIDACARIDRARRALAGVSEGADWSAQAERVDGVAAALGDEPIADAELAQGVAEARAALGEWARMLRAIGALSPEIAKTQATMDDELARDKPLTDAINETCGLR